MAQVAGHGEKLTRKAEQAVAALLQFPTIPEAAKAAGVSERTLYGWLQEEGFREQYRSARTEVVRHAVTMVQKASGEAVDVLREVMNNPQSTTSSRVSAAKTILELALKAVELEDVESRLVALEEKVRSSRGEREWVA
jgi:DNA-binding transcriptional MerR regulator